MSFLATTTAKIATGSSEDAYGDPVSNPTPAEEAKPWPVSIIEKSRKVIDPTSGEMRTVRYAVGRIARRSGVTDGDRLHDQRTAKVWLVDEIADNPRTIAGASELRLDLRLVSGE